MTNFLLINGGVYIGLTLLSTYVSNTVILILALYGVGFMTLKGALALLHHIWFYLKIAK